MTVSDRALTTQEKTRSVALLMPQLVLDGKEAYFHYMAPSARQAAVASASRGLCQVLVLEHLEGDVVERALAMKEAPPGGAQVIRIQAGTVQVTLLMDGQSYEMNL
eukprot:Skav214350  [mRNA]  locus=scaffold86:463657:465125:+ [translate_table: standard]